MIYLDTSAIAPFYWPEGLSDTVVSILRQEPNRALSELTIVELYSALSRRVRTKDISPLDARKIVEQVQDHLKRGFYQRIVLSQQHYDRAQEWLARFNTPLRALDALHLAIACLQELVLVTADVGLAHSAETLDIPVQLLKLK